MALYTILDQEKIQQILADYGITGLVDFKVLSGGSQNTNYEAETQSGKFVLTICEQNTPAEANKLADILEHLNTHQFSTSKIVRTQNNHAFSLWNGKPVMLKEFLKGTIQENLSGPVLKLIGQELGKLHQVEAPAYLPKTLSYGIEHFADVEKYAADSAYYAWLQEKQTYIASYLSPNLPKAFIHSDVFDNNVIISDDESSATIMDFEQATYYYRIFDLGMTILGVCRSQGYINLEKVKHLLAGYSDEIRLLPLELNSLKPFAVYAATAMSFWRHRNFHYTVPTPAMFDHYKALKAVANQINALPEDCFLALSR